MRVNRLRMAGINYSAVVMPLMGLQLMMSGVSGSVHFKTFNRLTLSAPRLFSLLLRLVLLREQYNKCLIFFKKVYIILYKHKQSQIVLQPLQPKVLILLFLFVSEPECHFICNALERFLTEKTISATLYLQ